MIGYVFLAFMLLGLVSMLTSMTKGRNVEPSKWDY